MITVTKRLCLLLLVIASVKIVDAYITKSLTAALLQSPHQQTPISTLYSKWNSHVGFSRRYLNGGHRLSCMQKQHRTLKSSSISSLLLSTITADENHDVDVEQEKSQQPSSETIRSDNNDLEFRGKNKWLGGAVDSNDGSIYGIPSNAKEVICLYDSNVHHHARINDDDDNDNTAENCSYKVRKIPLPSNVANGKFKWLRGIICNGYLYGIPAWANAGVLRINIQKLWDTTKNNEEEENFDSSSTTPKQVELDMDVDINDDEIVSILPLPPFDAMMESKEEEGSTTEVPSRWLWHGAALNANQTAIYCIPSNAHHVLKIDLQTFTTSFLKIPKKNNSTPLEQTNKWYGGILGMDNAVYGVPYAASGVLKIDTNTDTVQILGDFGVKKYNWHGGILSPKNGAIYAFPAHNNRILKIDTTPTNNTKQDDQQRDSQLSLLDIQRAPYDNDTVTRYKWLGGSLGANGNIYCMPSDASSILRIDTETDVATTFGVVSGEKNKWQGGVLASDGYVYAIPSNAKHILCLDTNEKTNDEEPSFSLLGDILPTKDKWQGGFIGNDGDIYCIPENFKRVMKVTPRGMSSTLIQFM